jgi:hypothetical protein
MTEVLLTCTWCRAEIAVGMDHAILRMDETPRAAAELLFCCPSCTAPSVRHVVGELLTLLLFVGVEPLRLSEPALPADDRPPCSTPFVVADVLAWHEQLAHVEYVTPWER